MSTLQSSGERCAACGARLDLEEQLFGGGVCSSCEDERAAEEHGEDCECDACGRVRSRYAAELRMREALHSGGLSRFGLEVLGWLQTEGE